MANKRLKRNQTLTQQGRKALKQGRTEEAEKLFRDSLTPLIDVTRLRPEGHRYFEMLHEQGGNLKRLFGCTILPDSEGKYAVSCPVILAHISTGFSPGGSGTRVCTVCGENSLKCEHSPGARYDNVVRKTIYGQCNICRKSKCKHVEGERFNNVRADIVIVDWRPDHIAATENPRDPLTRVESIGLVPTEIEAYQYVDKEFEPGISPLECNHCISCSMWSARMKLKEVDPWQLFIGNI